MRRRQRDILGSSATNQDAVACVAEAGSEQHQKLKEDKEVERHQNPKHPKHPKLSCAYCVFSTRLDMRSFGISTTTQGGILKQFRPDRLVGSSQVDPQGVNLLFFAVCGARLPNASCLLPARHLAQVKDQTHMQTIVILLSLLKTHTMSTNPDADIALVA